MKSYNTKSSHIQEYLVLYEIIIIWHGMEFSWIARYAMLYDSSVKAPPHARYGLCWVSPGAGYPFLWGVMSVRWPWHGQPTLCHEPAENIKWKFLKTNPWNTKANPGCKPRPRIIINHPALMILMIFWWSKEALEQSCDDQISVALLILSSVQAVTANIGRIISCSRSFKTTVAMETL